MQKYVTIVGSRESLKKYEHVITLLAFILARTHILRSGRAVGPDTWAELGYIVASLNRSCVGAEIFIPDKYFRDTLVKEYTDNSCWTIDIYDRYLMDQATDLVKKIHPNWDACDDYAKSLHVRNVFQVLGKDLSSPSELCVFCANEFKGQVFGGTRTATVLCDMFNVPKLNVRTHGPKATRKFLSEFCIDFDYCKSKVELQEIINKLNRLR